MRRGVPHAASVRPPVTLIPAIGDDGLLYPVEKMDAHRRGLLHLAVSVFVFDGDALLIQRRGLRKYHCGGQWANTCCTHPNWGETPARAAARRTAEELGFRLALAPAGTLTYRADVGGGLTEHERVEVFTAHADRASLRIAPNPEEVMATRWATRATLEAEAKTNPENLAPWFRIYLARWDELNLPAHEIAAAAR